MLLLTISASLLGGFLLMKCKVPGGMLVGAILGVTALNLIYGQSYMVPQARIVAQVLTGVYIGGTVKKEDLRRLPHIIKPYLMVMSTFLVLNLTIAACIYRLTDLDLLTCLFCAAPSGMSDTPLIALDMGADASMVTVMQFVRMLFGIGCLPSIILLSDRHAPPSQEPQEASVPKGTKPQASLLKFLPVFGVALAAGILGKASGIPAGTLSFALLVSIALKFAVTVPPMPTWVRRLAQAISGCCIGVGVTRSQLLQVRQLLLPAILLCSGYILCCLGMGRVISRIFHLPVREGMLYFSPAGATEMALIAADLGVHSTDLVVIQICRLVGVMVIFPQIFTVLVNVFG